MDRTPWTQKIKDRALQELSNDVFTNEIRTHMKDKIWIWRSISLTSVMRRLHNSADKESLFWPPADQQFLFSEDSNDDQAALWTLPPSTLFDVALRPVREPSIGVGHPFKVGENEDFKSKRQHFYLHFVWLANKNRRTTRVLAMEREHFDKLENKTNKWTSAGYKLLRWYSQTT